MWKWARTTVLVAAVISGISVQRATAADTVAVGVLRFVSSGPLFLAVERGYFTAEGLTVDLKFFEASQPVAVAVVSGDIQFGLTGITAGSINLAGKGGLKVIASQGAEKKGYTGNILVSSNEAWSKGLNGFEKLSGASVAVSQVGSTFHYQLGQIASAKGFDLSTIVIKPLQALPNMAAAVKTNQVDAAILPPHIAGPMAERGEVKLIGPLSDIADYQYGALFTSPRLIADKRDTVARFVRAYQKGLKDYGDAFLRADGRKADDVAMVAAAQIAKYVYPSEAAAEAAKKVIASAPYCDPSGKLDLAGIASQVAWYKAQKFVDAAAEAQNIVDLSFVQ